ncbi:MAG: DUF547 domain-containing protein [Bacteroidota bacterium]
MRGLLLGILLISLTACNAEHPGSDSPVNNNRLLEDSGALLLTVKRGKPTDSLKLSIANISSEELDSLLSTDEERITFWLNVYNAFFQDLAKRNVINPETSFKEPFIVIGGDTLSLDDVEHGVLRGQTEYSSSKWKVRQIDPRIHFALNCGASSCPPIAFYEVEKLDKQLEQATVLYIKTSSILNVEEKKVEVSQLFEWFEEDFEDRGGVHEVLSFYLEKDLGEFEIDYTPWDWSLVLNNYQ